MFDSDVENSVFRRRLLREIAPEVPVHLSFYSPSIKVQVMRHAETLPGANGRYVGDAVTIEFVPEDAAAVERVREYVWHWEEFSDFTAVRKINHARRGICPSGVASILERVKGIDRRAAAKVCEVIDSDDLREMIAAGDWKSLSRLPGIGEEKRARSIIEFYENERSGRIFLYAANRNDRLRGRPVVTELDFSGDIEGQVFDHAAKAQSLGDPDPLSGEEPPGHTTVRDANLAHPLPMTPSLMGRSVFHPEQVEHFAEILERIFVNGERLAGVNELRIQRGKVFHTAELPGVGEKTRNRVLASGLLDDEYTFENLVTIPGVTQAQARTLASAVSLQRTEVRVS